MPTDPVGEIPVEITGDYGPLEKAFQAAMDLAKQAAGKIAEGFNSGLSGINEGANEFSETLKEFIEHPLESAVGALTGFVEALGPLGVAAVAAGGAFALVGKEIVDLVLEEGAAAEATSNLANRLNLSFEDTKKLSEMAQIAGVNIDGLARVSMKLADALEDPAGAGKKVSQALHDMDISAKDSGDALLQLLEKLSEIPDATERIAKAHEIMGRSAVQLEPLLRDYKALGDAVDELGGKLSDEAVAALKAADDAADKLSITWSHLKEGLAATFAPVVMQGLEALTKLFTSDPKGTIYQQIANLKNELIGLNKEANQLLANKSFMQLLAFTPESEGGGGATGAGKSKAQQAIEDQIHSLEQLAAAQERSKSFNDDLDKSNAEAARNAKLAAAAAAEAQKKAAEAAKKWAEEVKKTNEQYRILFLSFQGVDDKLQGLKAIKFEQSLFPPSWFKEMKEFLAMEDKAIEEATRFQMKMEGQRAIKLIPFDVKEIENLTNAWKILGSSGSQALNDNLTKAVNAYNEAIKTTLFTTHDLAVLQNQILSDQLKIAEAKAGNKDLEQRLALEIRIAEVTGASAEKQIVQLENLKLHQEALYIQTHTLGDLYKSLNDSFLNVFDNLDKGLVKLITGGASIGDTIKGIAKSLEVDLVSSFTHALTQGLKAAFIDSGVGQAISGFLKNIFGNLFGGLFKTAGEAPGVAATTANTAATTANTAALTTLSSAMGSQSAAAAAGGGIPGGGGAAGGLGGLASGVTAISSAVTAIASVLQFLQGRRMEQDIGRIEVTTRGMLNQLISLQGTFNDYLPQLTHLVDIWAEIMVTNDILRLMAQNGGGLGTGTNNGADPDFGQHIADIINGNPSNSDDSYRDLQSSLTAQKQAADDYTNALQTTASTAYSLDEAVSTASDSLAALNQATRQVQGSIPALTQDVIAPALADSISNNPQFMQGAMMPHVNNPIQYGSIAPVVGGPGVTRGGTQPTVSIYAVDPNGRQLANATQKGLEEIGIRTR